ncbi:MAG: signal peptidase I [Candidatus Vogelbacteria bacterium]|nr:signal peptidase I [Candidatus Vogelbacteria bacterium]
MRQSLFSSTIYRIFITKKYLMTPESKKSLIEAVRFALTILIIVVPIRTFVAQPFIVSGDSMFPTFKNREYLIIDQLSYQFRSPIRGEVAVFHYPKDPSKYFIKRVIGLPGETVTIRGKQVSVTSSTGEAVKLDESQANYTNGLGAVNLNRKLEAGEYFVMGDNRDWSLDSRAWGPVPEELFRGRALIRLFPFNMIDFLPGSIN